MSDPKDKYHLVYILFILHGFGILMPWHSITYAFVNFEFSNMKKDDYRNYLGGTAFGTRILFQVINMFVPKRFGSLSSRILISLAIQVFVMAFTVLLVFSSAEQMSGKVFTTITTILNVVMSVGSGVYNSSAFGLVAVKPMKYTYALWLGLCLEGVMMSSFENIFFYMKLDLKIVAVFYFSVSIILQIFCIVLEIALNSKKFRIYYRELTENNPNPYSDRKEEMDIKGNQYLYVFRQTSEQILDIFLIFFVSFTIFPGVMTRIKSSDDWFFGEYLSFLLAFLYTEVFKLIGVITANYFQYPTPKSMISFTSARLLLIPIHVLFDYQPKEFVRSLPVLFKSDLLFYALTAILGITCGHFSALSLMYAPKQVRPQYSHIAGMMSSFTILIGAMFGFYFSTVLAQNV